MHTSLHLKEKWQGYKVKDGGSRLIIRWKINHLRSLKSWYINMIKFDKIIGNLIWKHNWEWQQIKDHLLQPLKTGNWNQDRQMHLMILISIIFGLKILGKKISHIWKTVCFDEDIYMIDQVHQKFSGNKNGC